MDINKQNSFYSLIRNRKPGAEEPNRVFTKGGDGPLELRKPLKELPGRWTRFKAVLSSVPLLGQHDSLQRARQYVTEYPTRVRVITNRQILDDFRKELISRYGADVATIALDKAGIDIKNAHAFLTAHKVAVAFNEAEHLQAMRAESNITITKVFAGTTNPFEGMPEQATHFLKAVTTGICRQLPAYDQGKLSEHQVAGAATEAIAFYDELRAAPGMDQEQKLEDILRSATQNATPDHRRLIENAREFVIADRLEVVLDWHVGGDLHRMAADVAAGLGSDPPSQDVLKSISRSVVENLKFAASGLAEKFGCAPHPSAILEKLEPQLGEKMKTAISEHLKALEMIRNADSLNDPQKDLLLQIGSKRRIDPVQVRQYERIAGQMGTVIDTLNPQSLDKPLNGDLLFQHIHEAIQAYENGVVAMKEHGGEEMWEAGSLSGGDMTNTLRDQFLELAVKERGLTGDQALLDRLTSNDVQDLVLSKQETDSLGVNLLMTTVYAVAIHACGKTDEEAMTLAASLTAEARLDA